MNTDKTLRNKFYLSRNGIKYNLLKKKMREIDVDDVIFYLLKYSFMVDINGSKYDITFGINKDGEIGFSQTYYPNSEQLTSYEITRKAFREGKWFYLTDKDLTEDEFKENQNIIKELEDRSELKSREFIIDRTWDGYVDYINKLGSKVKCTKEECIEYVKSLSREEFNNFINKSK